MRRTLLIALGLLALGLLAYGPVWRNGFVYEDFQWTYQPVTLAALASLRPGQWLMGATWSSSPPITHAINFSVHLVNTLLIGILAWRLGLSRWAWLVAGLFLVHPIQVEAVAYGSGRSELLVTTGLLLTATLLVGRWTWIRLLLAVSVALLTMGVKQTGVVVVGIAALVCLWHRRRVWIAVAVAPLALLGMPELLARNARAPVGWLAWWRWESLNVWTLLRLVVWPVGFSVEHDPMSAAPWVLLAAFCAAVIVAALLFWVPLMAWSRPLPFWTFGVYWAVIVLLPRFALIMPSAPLNEHHFYGAFAGLALSVGGLLEKGTGV